MTCEYNYFSFSMHSFSFRILDAGIYLYYLFSDNQLINDIVYELHILLLPYYPYAQYNGIYKYYCNKIYQFLLTSVHLIYSVAISDLLISEICLITKLALLLICECHISGSFPKSLLLRSLKHN